MRALLECARRPPHWGDEEWEVFRKDPFEQTVWAHQFRLSCGLPVMPGVDESAVVAGGTGPGAALAGAHNQRPGKQVQPVFAAGVAAVPMSPLLEDARCPPKWGEDDWEAFRGDPFEQTDWPPSMSADAC